MDDEWEFINELQSKLDKMPIEPKHIGEGANKNLQKNIRLKESHADRHREQQSTILKENP